jgi:type IX secretion system PorP/SprF family membrane protein
MKNIFSILTLLISVLFGYAQEGQFSQYYAAPTILNPAVIGTMPNVAFNINYKRGGNPTSEAFIELSQFTFSYPFKSENERNHQVGAAGLTVFTERRGFEGIYLSRKVMLSGTYAIKLSDIYNEEIIFGLQGGVVEHKLNNSNLTWQSQYNQFIGFDGSLPSEPIDSNPIFYPTFNFGIIYVLFNNEELDLRNRSLIAGISVDNLNRADISFSNLESANKTLLWKAFGSILYPLNERWSISPSTYILNSQGIWQVNAGTYLTTLVSGNTTDRDLTLQFGGWYRFTDSFIALIGLGLNDYRVGFSMDFNSQSSLIAENLRNNSSISTYEVSISVNLDNKRTFRNNANPIF